MKHYDDNLEKYLTAIFGVIGTLAILGNLFLKGWTNENILDGLKDLAGLLVTVVVFIIAMRTMKNLNYSNFRRAFEKYLQEWVELNKYLIDDEKEKKGIENKEFYYMLTKAHHNNVVLQDKKANEFKRNEGSIYHKGVFLYTDYNETEEITIGLNRAFFIAKRGGKLPNPFGEIVDIANEFKNRIIEHFEGKFEYINKSDIGIPIKIKDNGTRLHISIKKIANTKENAKIAIDMIEYIKTLIIALA
ncbi:MAG: hypothetical protein JEY97_06770 [Bacteroidales bacterium]|nr:hypothetical protein [Bacteroidales bacterium]